jgi:hypothetical protein
MSETPPAAASDEGVAPFQVHCPICRWDSDSPEDTFLVGPVPPVRDTAFLHCRLKCEGCGIGFNRVLTRPGRSASGWAGRGDAEGVN